MKCCSDDDDGDNDDEDDIDNEVNNREENLYPYYVKGKDWTEYDVLVFQWFGESEREREREREKEIVGEWDIEVWVGKEEEKEEL